MPNATPHDLTELKINVSKLENKIDTIDNTLSSIKEDTSEFKQSMSSATSQISEAMVLMATVTEKMNHNFEDHKNIYSRIEKVEDHIDTCFDDYKNFKDEFNKVKTIHELCIERRKVEEDTKKNSVWQKAKVKALEWFIIIVMCLTVFIMCTHFREFLDFMNKQSNVSVIGNKP